MIAHASMRGSSMLPLLREGMLLEVDRSGTQPRVGHIAVFRAAGRLVAHRVIRRGHNTLICSGDAQPDRLDVVPADALVGSVRAVYLRDGQGLRRVDTPAFWLHGFTLAYTHPARALLQRFLPRRRERVYEALCGAMSGVLQSDPEQLLRHIEGISPGRLAFVAAKHRVDALLCEAVNPLQHNGYARAVYQRVRRSRWSAGAFANAYRRQVLDVVRILQGAKIQVVLLKGAARAFRREPDWDLHRSSDIDVMVERPDLQRARAALEAAGYTSRCDGPLEEFYRTRHHHAAPLYPQSGVPVEIHHALYPTMMQSTALSELRANIVEAHEDGIAAATLDRPATAAHFAIHSAVRAALRDVVLLARLLTEMTPCERLEARRLLEKTGGSDVRARAVLALAARIAALPWESDARVERYVRWTIEREDLPRPLRARPHCVDAWFASDPGKRLGSMLRAASETASPRTACARVAAGAVTAVYLALMR